MRGEILMDLTHNSLKIIKYKKKKKKNILSYDNNKFRDTIFFMGAACVQ